MDSIDAVLEAAFDDTAKVKQLRSDAWLVEWTDIHGSHWTLVRGTEETVNGWLARNNLARRSA